MNENQGNSSDRYCETLSDLDQAQAIRAIHQAWIQLNAMSYQGRAEVDGTEYDNRATLQELATCLRAAGHLGFKARATK
jgi:hypothetical protein